MCKNWKAEILDAVSCRAIFFVCGTLAVLCVGRIFNNQGVQMATRQATTTAIPDPRTLLLGVFAPGNKCADSQDYFDEFVSLVDTLGSAYEMTYFTKIRSIDKGYLLTKGKLDEVVKLCDDNTIERIICSERLTPLQHRELEDITRTMVIDRAELILEIFKKSATTAEGQLQIEMAELEIFKTRMSGHGADFAQQSGHLGDKGPGETYKEKIKRILAEKLRKAGQKIDALQRARDTQRKQRLSSNVPMICIVGYTNAGKSSLLNVLTKSDVFVEDKLFATLDTTTREWFVASYCKALISDTVGFISELPHKLIEAFRSTLDEVRYADLLLHVVDVSNSGWQDQVRVVQETLEDLGIDESKPVIYLFNKIDKLDEEELAQARSLAASLVPGFFINTRSREGVAELIEGMPAILGCPKPEQEEVE